MTWQLGAALNAVIGACYLTITWIILRGLWRTGQTRTNMLALATGMIFFTCAVHHGGHTLHVLLPALGIDQVHGEAMRRAFTWQMDAWDAVGAGVAIFYVTLRRSYGRLLHNPEMFENVERARYERRLEEERASLADAQALAHLGSWRWDPQLGASEWSAEVLRILGRAADDPPASPLEMLATVDPEDHAATLASFRRAVATNAPFDLEFRYIGGDGLKRHLHAIGRREGSGVYVGTIQDVTARRQAEAALQEAEHRLRIITAHAPIGVALVDLDEEHPGRLLSVNQALVDLVGQPEDALTEMALSSITHPDDLPAVRDALSLLRIDARARTEVEVRLIHGDGHIVWTLLSAATVPEDGGHGRAVFHAMDIGERKRFEGQLQYLADHDALTGLFNRRRFEEELVRALAHSTRYRTRGAVMLVDLDGFKVVNDTLGHSHGDELVLKVGRILREALRETDVLARAGGDEFALIVPEVDEVEALKVAEKILRVVREQAIAVRENRHARVTASVGVSTYNADVELTAEELMVEADIAMYEAKERGKDQASLYVREQDPGSRLVTRQSWLEQLRSAGADGRFELMAQPIPGICSNGIPRFELLLRLRGEQGELIPPSTFLYIAERFDLIQEIDRWVFGEAVRLLRLHEERGEAISLSVNMSGKTIGDPRLLHDITQTLTAYPVPENRLVVEVTETAAIVNIERARLVARRLRELGCRFALDDFGAGFASFYYLKHLEFDFLKIDGEFIKSLTYNPTDQLVVQSVVDIARGLGAKTVAEYVGGEATVERLRELGVDYGQGYFLGRPLPLASILPAMSGEPGS